MGGCLDSSAHRTKKQQQETLDYGSPMDIEIRIPPVYKQDPKLKQNKKGFQKRGRYGESYQDWAAREYQERSMYGGDTYEEWSTRLNGRNFGWLRTDLRDKKKQTFQ